jgi:outer membrane protein assembly factor BamB
LNTGTLAWEASPTTFQLAPPTVADGVVYVGAQDSVLYALDAITGDTLWSFSTAPGGIRTQPAVSNGVVYFGNMAGYLYALDTQTHTERWSTRNPLRQPGAFSGLGDYYPPLDVSPVIVGNTLYYYNYEKLLALQVP